MLLTGIDFGQLYRDQMALAGGKEKPASAWDARALEMQKRPSDSHYTQAFIELTNTSDCSTVLDMGCGTGAIGLALAAKMHQVIGMDYSIGMLQAFESNARKQGITNIRTIQRAWEDSWEETPKCDLVVASRSTTVMDMTDALQKLDRTANKRVCLTNLVGGSFIDRGLIEALGREVRSIPDYIYILNILYQMGRHPRLDYIEANGRLAGTANVEDFVTKAELSLGTLSDSEKQRAEAWYLADSKRAKRGGDGFKWAFISWDTN
ncbi:MULTISPECIES: class I SAM-dependent methyltransferase [Marinobacter]|uniref:Methyltransferase domain-containing protein n=1 Tax=Marinobacter xiaoshiensis TaxID=3073652 RepID=A0ABU2HF01_9GAMM|nr:MULTISPECIES: methyltransferase domain-containing protein [unclassified Marinobacter]MBK1885664.1 methyltransferase domain-containing protein [Marinobacter sp. DY40_1A1]MDS1309654.1 methyltransferase domain-containing protein [Marinobacter sp. F60267]